MTPTRPSRALAIAAAVALVPHANAQPPAPITQRLGVTFAQGTLEQHIEDTKHTGRVLLVYLRPDSPGGELCDRHTWTNPTLAAWIRWHGVALRISQAEQPALYNRLITHVKWEFTTIGEFINASRLPAILVYRNGRLDTTIPDPTFHNFLIEDRLGDPLVLPGQGLNPKSRDEMFYLKPLQVLLNLDLKMDKWRSTDPVWFARHQSNNPEPAPPDQGPLLHTITDTAAPAFTPDDTQRTDPWAILNDARDLVRAAQYFEATAAYTYLWERAHLDHPSFAAARVAIVLPEFMALAQRRPGSRARLQSLRDRLEERQPWWTYDELYDWVRLSQAMGEDAAVAEYLTLFTIDPGGMIGAESAMLPRDDAAVYNTIAQLPSLVPIDALDARDLDQRATLIAIAARRLRPASVTSDRWALVTSLRQRILTDEAARHAAAMLLKQRPDDARRALDWLPEADRTPDIRLMIAGVAMASGATPTPELRDWITHAPSNATPILRAWADPTRAP